MKTRTDKLHTAKVLTEQELRNVVGGTRQPARRLDDPGGSGQGGSSDVYADPFSLKG